MKIKVTYTLCLQCKNTYRTVSFDNMSLGKCLKCRKLPTFKHPTNRKVKEDMKTEPIKTTDEINIGDTFVYTGKPRGTGLYVPAIMLW